MKSKLPSPARMHRVRAPQGSTTVVALLMLSTLAALGGTRPSRAPAPTPPAPAPPPAHRAPAAAATRATAPPARLAETVRLVPAGLQGAARRPRGAPRPPPPPPPHRKTARLPPPPTV